MDRCFHRQHAIKVVDESKTRGQRTVVNKRLELCIGAASGYGGQRLPVLLHLALLVRQRRDAV